MRLERLVTGLASLLLAAPLLRAQNATQFFPLSEVRPGLKGVGRTVFEGDRVDEFQVELLGVLKNAVAPKQDLILARLSGGPLEKTGVIAGMSGSPVYIDGKLVGAVARAFPFAKEAITGITPIEQMVQVVPEAVRASAQTAGRQERLGCLAASSSQKSKTDVCATPSAGEQTRQSHRASSREFRIVLARRGSGIKAPWIPQTGEKPPARSCCWRPLTPGHGPRG